MADISFPSLPNNWRLPLFWAEVDPSQAGSGQAPLPSLLVGQKLAVGTAPAGIPIAIATLAQAQQAFGVGSMLERMFARFFAIEPTAFIFCLPLADPGGGVASTGKLAISTAATVAGVYTTYIAGQRVQINVAATDAVTDIAANLVAAINAVPTLPVTAVEGGGAHAAGSILFASNPTANDTVTIGGTVVTFKASGATGLQVNIGVSLAATLAALLSLLSGSADVNLVKFTYAVTLGTTLNLTAVAAGTAGNALTIAASAATPSGATLTGGTALNSDVNLTCRWVGDTGNDIILVSNYGGRLAGEVMPTGMTVTITAMSGGVGTPSMSAPIGNLGDDQYYFVGLPYTDTVSLAAWDVEYGFTSSGRWGWLRQLYGNIYGARRDTYSNLIAWGPTGNSGVESVMGVEPTSPSPVWEWTAAYAAQATQGFLEDPARPLQTLELTGILLAPKQDRWTKSEGNAMASVGIAVQLMGSNGYPQIMVEATRYQLNSYGQSDNAYFLVTTLTTLAELLRRMKSAITSKFPRHKLANDGTNFATGQAIITPKIAKGEIISEYSQAQYEGLVENKAAFVAGLIVSRASPPNNDRLNVLWDPDLINQLRIFAVLAQFRLQFPIAL